MTTRKRLFGLAAVYLAILVITPLLGTENLTWSEISDPRSAAHLIFWDLRIPRVLLGLLVGGSLAVAGVALQGLFRNPLAEPYTLGVASGASLGAVAALTLGAGVSTLGIPLIGMASFAGSLAVSLTLIAIASRQSLGGSHGLLLAGVAISLSCSALILLAQYLADSTQTYRMVRWMMGGLSVVGFAEVLWLTPFAFVGSAYLFFHRNELDLMLAGQEIAASRGVDLRRLRMAILGATSLMIAALVAVAGPIGFVGLIVPHLSRRWLGSGHLVLLPASFLGGGAFLALCDAVARRLLAPAELPVGVLTALIGGPFFLGLLLRSPRSS